MDVAATVADLDAAGVSVHCLALGGVGITSAAGKLTMHVVNAVVEFERDLLIERTQACLRRAMAEGRHPGRPHRLSGEERRAVLEFPDHHAGEGRGFRPGTGLGRELKRVFP